MSKKANKRRYNARRTSNRPAVVQSAPVSAPHAADLAEEYRYVYSDLKRLGILAAAMFTLLVLLALAVQYLL